MDTNEPWTSKTGPAYNLNHLGVRKIERKATHPILGRILQCVIDWCSERDWPDWQGVADRWNGEPELVSPFSAMTIPEKGPIWMDFVTDPITDEDIEAMKKEFVGSPSFRPSESPINYP